MSLVGACAQIRIALLDARPERPSAFSREEEGVVAVGNSISPPRTVVLIGSAGSVLPARASRKDARIRPSEPSILSWQQKGHGAVLFRDNPEYVASVCAVDAQEPEPVL